MITRVFWLILQGVPCPRRPGLGWLRFREFPRPVGSYCGNLLPKQGGGTSQIQVNKTQSTRTWDALYIPVEFRKPETLFRTVGTPVFFFICLPTIPLCTTYYTIPAQQPNMLFYHIEIGWMVRSWKVKWYYLVLLHYSYWKTQLVLRPLSPTQYQSSLLKSMQVGFSDTNPNLYVVSPWWNRLDSVLFGPLRTGLALFWTRYKVGLVSEKPTLVL